VKEKLNRFHERFLMELLRRVETLFGVQSIEDAAQEFFGWPDDLGDVDIKGHESLFYSWFVLKWRIDSTDGEPLLPGPPEVTALQSYLQSCGKRLAPLEREYLEGLVRSSFSFFQVTGVERGTSVSVRDLLLDCDFLVQEKAASQILNEGDVLYGMVVEVGGIAMFESLTTIIFHPADKVEILAMRQRLSLAGQGAITNELLDEYDLEIRELYLLLYRRKTAKPKLTNTDGEPLSFRTLKYTISSPRQVFDGLKGLNNGFATEAELLQEAEFASNGDLRKVEILWILPASVRHSGGENIVHGNLLINGSKMTCEVNSASRAKQLRELIEQRLPGGEAVYKSTVVQSVAAKIKEAKEVPFAAVTGDEELMNSPEVRQQVEEMMRRHWEQWPDIEIPALQGKTPRQAVQDELGRGQVEALLEDAERHCRNSTGAMAECGLESLLLVWRELGLEH